MSALDDKYAEQRLAVPPFARAPALSMLARDQSIAASSSSQFNKVAREEGSQSLGQAA